MALISTSIFESRDGEHQWICQVREILQDEVKLDLDVPVSIFRVPTALTAFKPEAYVPQLVGLGPYHHFGPGLYEMERYKLAAASRVHGQFKSALNFKQLVEKLKPVEQKIRACYHKYLDLEGETLGWVMAIDGLFLLELLIAFDAHVKEKQRQTTSSTTATTAHLVDSTGKKMAHGAILGDVMMLENQIPIFLLSKVSSLQFSLPDIDENFLPSLLMGFCKAVSPLKLRDQDFSLSQVCDCAHLLDLLYHLTVPKLEMHHTNSLSTTTTTVEGGNEAASFAAAGVSPSLDYGMIRQVFTKLWSLLVSTLNVGIISKITNSINNILGITTKLVSSVLGLISSIVAKKKDGNIKADQGVDSGGVEKKSTPVVEEIMIPSVSYLCDFGVEFCPTPGGGGIESIKFDKKTKKFFLPVITMEAHSEVVMRNLVAYEASTVEDCLVFVRYTELMNGIIDTAEDAKLLREKKIIVNGLKSDADVVEVFNGMSKRVRLTNVGYIDKAIEDVNTYFYSVGEVRLYRRIMNFVYGSWQILTILAVILVTVLMGLQTFCSVYSCPKIFHTTSTSTSTP